METQDTKEKLLQRLSEEALRIKDTQPASLVEHLSSQIFLHRTCALMFLYNKLLKFIYHH